MYYRVFHNISLKQPSTECNNFNGEVLRDVF